jgi:putative PEP-CTERM system TPR-repeat lipoprotein
MSRTFWMTRTAATALLSLGIFVGPAFATPERSQRFLSDAVKELEKGDVGAAVIQLRNAVQQDPNNLEARKVLGEVYLRSGDPTSAEKELRRAYEGAPSDEVELLLGRALLQLQNFDEALKVVKPTAGNPDLQLRKVILRGDAYLSKQDFPNAQASYNDALKIKPDDLDALFALARYDTVRGDMTSAKTRIDSLLKTNPRFVDGWALKAQIAVAENRLSDALESLNEAERLSPQNTAIQLARAQILLQSRQIEAADKVVTGVLTREKDNVVGNYLKATIELGRGNATEANRLFSGIQDRLREYPPALLLDGLIKFNIDQFSQAERSLSRYLAVVPSNLAARRVLAASYMRLNNLQGAVEELDRVLAVDAADPVALQMLASTQMRLGQFDAAAATYEKLRATGDAAASRQADTALSLLGEGAAERLKTELLPTDEVAREVQLVLELIRSREFPAALSRIEALKQKYPDNLVFPNLEGGVYLAERDFDKARATWDAVLKRDPNFVAAINNLDQLDLTQGKREAVLERLNRRLAKTPNDESLIVARAQLLAAMDQRDAAIKYLEEKRNAAPQSAVLTRALLSAYLTVKRNDDAVRLAEALAQSSGSDPESLRLAAAALLNARQAEKALPLLQKQVQLKPDAVQPQLDLAQGLITLQRFNDARAPLQKALQLDPVNTEAAARLVDVEIRAQKPDAAMAVANQVAAKDAERGARLKALVLQRTNRPAEAVPVLEEAFTKKPGGQLAIELYQARRLANQMQTAVDKLGEWVEANPRDNVARFVYASGLLEVRDYTRAANEYELLAGQEPNNAIILNNLAWLKSELGAPDAVSYARRAYEAAPESPEVADTLGWALVKDSKPDEGLTYLQKAAAARATDGNIQYHLAFALNAVGKREEARAILQSVLAGDGKFDRRSDAESLLARLKN